jgi:hypothetical protein
MYLYLSVLFCSVLVRFRNVSETFHNVNYILFAINDLQIQMRVLREQTQRKVSAMKRNEAEHETR